MKKKEERLTLQEEVSKRPIELAPNWVWFTYGFLARLPFFAPKYKPTYKMIDDPRDCKTGCFIIWNHQSRRDYLFLRTMMGKAKYSMVAGYTEFFRSHLAWMFKVARIIPKKPLYNNDMACVGAMMKIIRKGGIVAFSPEGTPSIFGDNQPIAPGTARFLKSAGVPVYCAEMHGHYLSSNKVDITDKPGHCEVTMYKLFSSEQLEELSAEEIDLIVNEAFHHDDYEWNNVKQYKFRGRNKMCNRLEHMLYECPKCGKKWTNKGEGNTFKCLECGNGFTMDHKYNMKKLTEDSIIASSPSKWTQWERQNIIKEIRKDPNFEFKGHYQIGGLPKYELIKNKAMCEVQGEVDFTIDHNGVHFIGIRNNQPCEIHIPYDVLYSPCVENDLTNITFYPNGESTDLIVNDGKGAYIIMLVQEMHRLHVNRWKNFPWFDYMYENLDEPSVLK